ncbi:MAG: zinc-dependent alcohol dehydrogenase family protein [Chloroflexi bacterium]|nr:MAG: zinc-dependent alcohol dehydrogenase family protein [Chloroflexota bacterium]
MRAMVVEAPRRPLVERQLPDPRPQAGEVLIRVHACAVCRTDLHIADGEIPLHKRPVVPGHQVVGVVEETAGRRFQVGDRIGVAWLAFADGVCRFCRDGLENLCEKGLFTGYDRDGGYAELVTADERFCYPLPSGYPYLSAAPLLCGGLIGFRAWRMAGPAERIGFYGFGSAAHIILQVARNGGQRVYAFVRSGDREAEQFALERGADWAGASLEPAPEALDAAIIFASAGELVQAALRAVRPGGTVVCAGIHMSDIPSFPYSILWGERVLRSVANLTRQDAYDFLELAPTIPIETAVETHPLRDANLALDRLRSGAIHGSAVLTIA